MLHRSVLTSVNKEVLQASRKSFLMTHDCALVLAVLAFETTTVYSSNRQLHLFKLVPCRQVHCLVLLAMSFSTQIHAPYPQAVERSI